MKTKLLAQQLQILVVSRDIDLLNNFKVSLSQIETEVQFQFKTLAKLENNFQEKGYYKIVWLVAEADILELRTDKLRWLNQLSAPLIITLNVPADLVTNDRVYQPFEVFLTKQKKWLTAIKNKLNFVQIILGFEVIDPYLNYLSIGSLSLIISQLNNAWLINPNARMKQILINDFYQTVIKLSLQPHQSGVVLVENTTDLTATEFIGLFKRVYEVYYHRSLKIKKQSLREREIDWLRTAHIVKIKSNLRAGIKLLVQNLGAPVFKEINSRLNQLDRLNQDNSSLMETKTPASTSRKDLRKLMQIDKHKRSDHQFDLNEEIIKSIGASRKIDKHDYVETLTQAEKKGLLKNKHKRFLFFAGLILTSLGLTILTLWLIFIFSFSQFKNQLNQLLSSASSAPITTIKLDKKGLDFLATQTDIYNKIIKNNTIDQAKSLLSFTQNFSQLHKLNQQLERQENEFMRQTFNLQGQSWRPFVDFDRNVPDHINKLIGALLLSLNNTGLEVNLSNERISDLEARLRQEQKQILIGQKVSPILNDLVGVTGRKQYLIIFQDNNELRPTGGFISVAALVVFNQGKMVSYQPFDSAQVDQNLGGEVIAPAEISKYLGEKRWFFRDANWYANFSISAKQLAWFVQKGLNQKIDGVIALDNVALSHLLSVVGELDLKQYNEVVTAKNLDEKLLFHAGIKDKANKTKEKYSVTLVKAFLQKITTLQKETGASLINRFSQLLTEQHVLLNDFKPSNQKVFNSLLWSGDILAPECPRLFHNVSCQIDNLSQVEANVGVNKANFFLKRSIKQFIKLKNHQALHRRIISYTNLAQTNAWPKGDYKSYVRIFLPVSTSGIKVVFDGKTLPLEIKKTVKNKIVSFFIQVPINSEKKLIVKFITPLPNEQPFSYLFFDQNQPGSKDDAYQLEIDNQLGFKPKIIAPKAKVLGNRIIFTGYQNKNLLYALKF